MINERKVIRYSESFKLEVVKEYETGGLTLGGLRQKYGISGSETITRWVKRYGMTESLPKIIRVEKPGEKDELKRIKKELQQLKEAMADLHLENVINKNTLRATAEGMGLTVEELKKKLGIE